MSKIKDTSESWNGKTYSEVEEFVKGELDRKAERADNPTAGNIAVLDESGNPTDSGHSPFDFMTEQQMKTVNGESLKGVGDIVIPRGRDAVNPFKGWFDDVETLEGMYENPSGGDYAYVTDSSDPAQTYIFYADGGQWVNSHRLVDKSDVNTFRTTEQLNQVGIDSTKLTNPSPTDLAKAQDIINTKGALKGITFEETRANGYEVLFGYISGEDGTIKQATTGISYKYCELELPANTKQVRMTTGFGKTSSWIGGYAFGYYSDGQWITVSSNSFDVGSPNTTIQESFINVPESSETLILRTTCKYVNDYCTLDEDNFYCYFRTGNTVIEEIESLNQTLTGNIKSSTQKKEEITDKYAILERGLVTNSKWNLVNNNHYHHIEIPITKGDKFVIVKDPEKVTTDGADETVRYTIAKQPDPTADDSYRPTVEYADGWSTVYVGEGKEYEITIDADYDNDYYLMVNCGPTYKTRIYKVISVIDLVKSETEKTETRFESIERLLVSKMESEIDLFDSNKKDYTNSTDSQKIGKWGVSAKYKHYEINLSNLAYVKIKTLLPTRYFFTNSNTVTPGEDIDFFLEKRFYKITSDDEVTVSVPDGAAYMMVYAGTNTTPVIDRITVLSFDKFQQKESNQWSLLDVVKDENDSLIIGNPVDERSQQVKNLQKKIRQMTDIAWSPKKNIPKALPLNGSQEYYIANIEYNGIPYSGNAGRSVGMGVSIETFMTAINNKYSLIYTEDLQQPSSSPWYEFGLVIRRLPTNSHCRLYYGSYCNALAQAATGQDIALSCSGLIQKYTHMWSYRVPQFSKDYIKIGDIFSSASSIHTRIVYDVVRNNLGEVISVKIAEATSNKNVSPNRTCKITSYPTSAVTLEQYINSLAKSYKHYSNNMLFKDVEYEPSPFVAVADEEITSHYTYNNDVCTFAGHKAVFLQGESVVINYNLNDDEAWDHTHLHIYKDNALIGSIALSTLDPNQYPSSQYGHACILNNDLLSEPGTYQVRSGYNNEAISEATEFEIVSDNVTLENLNDNLCKVTYTGNPSNWRIVGCIFSTSLTNPQSLVIPLPEDTGNEFVANIRITAEKLGLTYIPNGSVSLYIKTDFGMIRTNPHTV